MSYQGELALENDVIKQLESQGYERIILRNHEQLVENFRQILNERNKENLKNRPLSDTEFARLMTDISDKSVFDSAMQLRDSYTLERDDESKVYLYFLDTEHWCQNKFQVTNQVTVDDKYKARYDVTLLINGLPLVQIELKRSGIAISQAFNQIERYRKHNYRGLFRFIQLFVVSNKKETRYYANSDKEIFKSLMFYWSDKDNRRINNLKEFIQEFLDRCRIAKMISRYMITNETDKLLMALRPYQVYAVESLLNRATETNNNGYIWHTTGSGKTLTSFKTSQILSKDPSIKKVIFLVDRKDLDSQTLAEFNKFQMDSVDLTDNTHKLLKQLDDPFQKLIVTTIQKMANAVKSGANIMDKYQQDKVIFIIDECHRTQFGEMHRLIRQHFKQAQYFGFTGTPRFEENASLDGRATADIFEKCLHTYLIKDAIRDGNVLGFSVEYISTFANAIHDMDESYVSSIDENELWMADDRLNMIAKHLVANHHKKTRNQMYTSILTVQSIPMAIKYYKIFKQLKDAGQHHLNVSTIFTYAANEDTQEQIDKVHTKEELEQVMCDYNQMFDKNFSLDTFDGFFNDISKRVKQGNPAERLDILIVVDMFLTGFDSKKLNTLYVDRNLKYHGLIQAYSRTNRVEKETKPYGNIVCYRNLKDNTDKAIELFSQTNDTDTVLSPSFDVLLSDFKHVLTQLLNVVPTPDDVDNLEREDDQLDFVLAYRAVASLLQRLKTFDEFEFTSDLLGISQQTFEDYQGKYYAIYDKVKGQRQSEKTSVLDDIDFKIEILRNDMINVQYILDLLNNIDLTDKAQTERVRKQIKQLLSKADDDKLRLKAELIREFLDKVIPHLDKDAVIEDAYFNFEEEVKEQEIQEFANDKAYPIDLLKEVINEYEFSGQLDNNFVEQGITGGLLVRTQKIENVKSFVQETAEKYGAAN
ncbi:MULTISPECIES: type I restriction endonuclease subunit R [Staphylococcus]|uniref:Type I restriction enzyme endonuclease subunit n=2 Tax=Staphylococcus TaxID=1279 RepID=A0ABX6BSA4_STALU|nr:MULTISPECIES: type I restriction endonuclease subunit R [Staphylococcus]ADC86803.1 Type I restriction-modification system, restriction subunit R [Staphylococcus lugdunensis HKU09-01]ARJ08539.1 restriction endonuclease subunit R [Staphylococcus lugdunensis]ARJ15620.1 restriction endonuclease subunit R [Staphylococcus lugdunensis]ARJ29010.1 restriction endonuclease subunit R [Staphylococcus lugdunensis]EKS23613.1 HsdR family type I site-specific deoxyribonuclease [Staphylococcus lugdunensis A